MSTKKPRKPPPKTGKALSDRGSAAAKTAARARRPATSDRPEPLPPDAESWPLVRAVAPVPDIWRATGLGTAGVVRRRPDGRLACAFFTIHLLAGGLQLAFGKLDGTPQETDELVDGIRGQIPPMAESPIEQAALHAWGAFALSELDGPPFPPEMREQYLALMPRPTGSMRALRDALIGPGGPTPTDLMEFIAAHPMSHDVPEDQEILILTEMTFDVSSPRSAAARLRSAEPTFTRQDDGEFVWTRPYPKGHWSPFASLGARQVLGSVHIVGDALVAEAKALSMAAKLAATLKDLLGDSIRLRSTRWTGASDLLRKPRSSRS
ncbi:hypothetical protein WMF28_25000 [Sorangium sp. So ce590]|uniref:hypothetical protein n=1 Tax=Sorangium sp. So ce590 TaxID=3133317 RepID=UPI003F6286F6